MPEKNHVTYSFILKGGARPLEALPKDFGLGSLFTDCVCKNC